MVGFRALWPDRRADLLAGGRDVTVIDDSPDRIRQAISFVSAFISVMCPQGSAVAAGIERAKIVAVCTHRRDITDRIVDLIRSEFPEVKLFVRSYDRIHTISLRAREVDLRDP